MGKLTVAEVRAITKPGKYHDGDGPVLRVRGKGTKGWFFFYMADGKRREMSLRSFPDVGLADGRRAKPARRSWKAAILSPTGKLRPKPQPHRARPTSRRIPCRTPSATFVPLDGRAGARNVAPPRQGTRGDSVAPREIRL